MQRVLAQCFQEYGRPAALLSDNGAPFASPVAPRRFSALSAWCVTLGIRPLLTPPRHPEQNGRHERMHRTLKAEATRPAARTARAQQQRFDAFRDEYNTLRPHEALGLTPPARRSVRSLLIATGIALSASTLFFFISPLAEAQSELLARTRPTLYDVLIASFGGAAGIVAVARNANKYQVVPGVAIATALINLLTCSALKSVVELMRSNWIRAARAVPR